LVRHLVAATAMGAVLVGVVSIVGNAVIALVVGVVVGGVVYLGVLLLLRSRELGELRNLRRPSTADPEITPRP
jgi:predicted DNA repair protein MutK